MIELSPGQGSALSGLFTAIGAVIGIVVAGRFFSGKVKNLSEALDESRKLLVEHAASVRDTLSTITNEVNVLRDAVGSVGEQAARIESNVADAEALRQPEDLSDDALASWEDLRSNWHEVRDLLEEDANSDQLDGRRRAAYSRIDRRTYRVLIDRMERDKEIARKRANLFRDGLAIWLRHRNGRAEVARGELQKMREILDALRDP